MSKQVDKIPTEKVYPFLVYNYILNELPSTLTYEQRLLWQKVGYLAQQNGAPLHDYNFSWYKAGPYSSAYTSVLYNLDKQDELVSDVYSNYSLTKNGKRKLQSIKNMVDNKPENISVSKWLELLASLLYLNRNNKLNKKGVIVKLKRLKPFFDNDEHISFAWTNLEETSMI